MTNLQDNAALQGPSSGEKEVVTNGAYHPDDTTEVGDMARAIASYCDGEQRQNVYRKARDTIASLIAKPQPTPAAATGGDVEELLPCPFCGGEANWEHLENGRWSAGCTDLEGECMGFQTLQTFARKQDATVAWNTRAPLSPPSYPDVVAPFQRGDKIVKLKGHGFGNGEAEVVTCYRTKAGEWRVVAEHPEGWQFIFTPSQIALSARTGKGA